MNKELLPSELLKQLRQEQINILNWQNESLNFVPLRGSWTANSQQDFDLEDEVNKFLSSNKKVLLLIGDSGAGKSLYTQGFVSKRWQVVNEKSPIPVWISLPALKNPVNRVIEETFEAQGFTADQIEVLRKTRSFIFILDAYDEIYTLKNLYVTNHLERWNAKIIITCRREYLYTVDNPKLYFVPFHKEKAEHGAYREIVIRSFNANQIKQYIQQYLQQTPTALWKATEHYEKAIEEIPGLKNLVTTPFILKLTLEILPQIVKRYSNQAVLEKKQLTQAALYDIFIEQWFIRQEQKLKLSGQIEEEEDIKPEFWAYAKALAQTMHEQKVTQIYYENEASSSLFGEAETEINNPWQKFFNPQNKRIALLQTACLIREVGKNQYAFIHASLGEYFLTRDLYEHLMDFSQTAEDKASINTPSVASTKSNNTDSALLSNSTDVSVTWQQDYFNQRLLIKEYNTIQFLADRVEEDEAFKQSLFDRVYASKNNAAMQIAAANAITILNRAHVNFSNIDLSKINIPEADLSNAVMDNVQLQDANLEKVNFQGVWLREANLSNALMMNVYFGEKPWIQVPEIEAGTYCFCYSADKQWLAIGAGNGVHLYKAKDRTWVRKFTGHTKDIACLAFDPEGKYIASASIDSTIRLWSLENSNAEKVFIGHFKDVTCIAFDSKNRYLVSGSEDHTVRIWDIQSGKELNKLVAYQQKLKTNKEPVEESIEQEFLLLDMRGAIISISVNPSGKYIASAGRDKMIRLWDSVTGQEIRKFCGHTGWINKVVFDFSGEYIASASNDQTIRLWEVKTGNELLQLSGHKSSVTSIAFDSRGEQLISGSKDKTVRIWELKNGKELIQFSCTSYVTDVHFGPEDKYIVSSSLDNKIFFWELKEIKQKESRQFINAHIQSISSNEAKGIIAIGGRDGKISLLEIESGKILEQFKGHADWVMDINFDQHGKCLISVGRDKIVRLWDVDTKREFKSFQGHSAGITDIIYDFITGHLIIADADKTIRLWDIENNKELHQFKGHTEGIESLAIHAQGRLLASIGADSTVRLWDLNSKKEIYQWSMRAWNISFDKAGRFLAVVKGKVTMLYNVVNGKELMCLQGHMDNITSVVFSPYQAYLATGSNDFTVKIWELATGKCVKNITFPKAVEAINWVQRRDKEFLFIAAGQNLYSFSVLHKNNEFRFYLVWFNGHSELFLQNAQFNNVFGLDRENFDLIKQRGIQGEPVLLNKLNENLSFLLLDVIKLYEKKLEETKKKLNINQNALSSYIDLATMYLRNNNIVEANDFFKRSIIAISDKGMMLNKEKKYEEAVNCYDKSLTFNPNSIFGLCGKGITLSYQGKYEGSLECYEAALKLDKKNVICLYGKGVALEALGRNEEAKQCYNYAKYLETNIDSSSDKNVENADILTQAKYAESIMHLNRVSLCSQQELGDKKQALLEAQEKILESLDVEPQNNSKFQQLVNNSVAINVIRACGQGEAEPFDDNTDDPFFTTPLSQLNSNVLNLFTDTRIKFLQSNLISDLSMLPQSKVEESADSFSSKGLMLAKRYKFNKALECYEQALLINPSYTEAIIGKAEALESLKKYDEAIYCYKQALKFDPKSYICCLRQGDILLKQEKHQAAIECYDQALMINPHVTVAVTSKIYKQGEELFEQKKYDQAVKLFDLALMLNPNAYEVLNSKGEALEELELFEEALICYNQALSIDSKSIVAITNKGNALNALKKFDEALACYNQGLVINPRAEFLYRNKALIYAGQENYNAALECYNMAIVISRWRETHYVQPLSSSSL